MKTKIAHCQEIVTCLSAGSAANLIAAERMRVYILVDKKAEQCAKI